MKVESQNWPVRGALAVGLLGLLGSACGAADAAVRIEGQVQAGGGPVANSTVTLWAGSAGDPRQLAQAKTADDGSFALSADETPGPGVSLYVIAKGGVAAVNKGGGDNPALAFLSVLGGDPPANVTVNEMTTIASVWTNAQFLDGVAIKGPALSLSIAAGNFVDLATGGYGATVADGLNSTQTPTLANFATLADALAGCATRATASSPRRRVRRARRRPTLWRRPSSSPAPPGTIRKRSSPCWRASILSRIPELRCALRRSCRT